MLIEFCFDYNSCKSDSILIAVAGLYSTSIVCIVVGSTLVGVKAYELRHCW